jgi:hypothetical protein
VSAATSAALYPAIFACDVSASIDWARLNVRGSRSRLTAVTPRSTQAATRPGLPSGLSSPTSICPARSPSSGGGCTHSTMSARANTVAGSATVAPAST